MSKKALITGIAGQDGSYLAEYLLEKNYKVYGIVRRNSVSEHQSSRLDEISGDVETRYGDVLDISSLESGFYMTRVTINGKSSTSKLIIN